MNVVVMVGLIYENNINSNGENQKMEKNGEPNVACLLFQQFNFK